MVCASKPHVLQVATSLLHFLDVIAGLCVSHVPVLLDYLLEHVINVPGHVTGISAVEKHGTNQQITLPHFLVKIANFIPDVTLNTLLMQNVQVILAHDQGKDLLSMVMHKRASHKTAL